MEETIEHQKTFIEKIFHCCFYKNNEDFELRDDEDLSKINSSLLIKTKNELETEFSIFPTSAIREEEIVKIEFTKEGLLKFITNLQYSKYDVIYNENNIKISKRNSSVITDKCPLFRCEITKNKSYFSKVPKIQKLIKAMTEPELRKKWDDNIKVYKIVEKINNNSEIIKIITNKQYGLISEKEFYDKRIEVINNGVHYLYSSSIPDSNNFISLDYDKAINYICLMIVKEDEDNFYFDCYNQVDININLPDKFLETNLPNKIISFFNKYFEFLNTL
jgi:hypothetical protein